jgi:hypothetical protein
MNKIRKRVIIAIIASAILATVNIASADVDVSGDVYHHKVSTDGETWIYEKTMTGKEDVDIKEITYGVTDNTLSITFEVFGNIQTSTKHVYIFYYNTSDATYIFTWSNIGTAIGYDWVYYNDPDSIDPLNVMDHMVLGTVSADGSTITGSIELMGSSEPTNAWGSAIEYTVDFLEIEEGLVEWYGDYWPNIYAPWYGIDDQDGTEDETDNGAADGTGDSTTNDNSPGFELVALFAGIALLLFIFRKKK